MSFPVDHIALAKSPWPRKLSIKAAFRRIRELSKAFLECECYGACPTCMDRQEEVFDIAEAAIRALDGPPE